MNQIAASGVQAPAAGGQGQGTGAQPAGGQPQTPAPQGTAQQPGAQAQPGQPAQPQGEVAVPLHVVTALRDELSKSKGTAQQLQQQLQQFQAMQMMGGIQQQGNPPPATPGPQAQPQAQPDPLAGLEDTDIVNVKDLKAIVQSLRGNAPDLSQALGPINATLARMQVQLQDPRYETTIKEFLPEMITSQPFLREMIVRTPNPLLAALSVARMNPRYMQAQQAANGQQPQQPQAQQQDVLADLQRIIENATKPGAPGAMGGGGAISGHDRFRTMSDAEFNAEVNRVLNRR